MRSEIDESEQEPPLDLIFKGGDGRAGFDNG